MDGGVQLQQDSDPKKEVWSGKEKKETDRIWG